MYLQINAWIHPRRYAPRQDDVLTVFNELMGHDTTGACCCCEKGAVAVPFFCSSTGLRPTG